MCIQEVYSFISHTHTDTFGALNVCSAQDMKICWNVSCHMGKLWLLLTGTKRNFENRNKLTHTHYTNERRWFYHFTCYELCIFPPWNHCGKKRGQHFYFDDIIPSSALILSFSMTFCHLQTKLNGSAVMVCGAFQHRYTTRLNIEKMKE